jgi:hypothetical protein
MCFGSMVHVPGAATTRLRLQLGGDHDSERKRSRSPRQPEVCENLRDFHSVGSRSSCAVRDDSLFPEWSRLPPSIRRDGRVGIRRDFKALDVHRDVGEVSGAGPVDIASLPAFSFEKKLHSCYIFWVRYGQVYFTRRRL